MKPIQISATMDRANRRKDRTISVTFTSNAEISTDDYSEIDRRLLQEGWLLFSSNELQTEDLPKEQAPAKDSKKPSLRMRGVLWHIWDQNTDKSEEFQTYYERQMEKLIIKLKEQLS